MKSPLALILAATTLVIPVASADGTKESLQGRWSIVTVPEGWKKVPGTSVVINASEVQICLGRIPTASLSYRLNASAGTVEARRQVKGKTVIQRGVFRQAGDVLTLSVGPEGKPAPASPDTTGGGAQHWVFRRIG